ARYDESRQHARAPRHPRTGARGRSSDSRFDDTARLDRATGLGAVSDPRRELPSVSALLESPAVGRLMAHAPRAIVVGAVRDAVARARKNPSSAPRGDDEWASAIGDALAARSRPSLRPVFNATGVVLHTNLGRAPLARAAIEAIAAAAAGYSNLEYDIERGARGSRYSHCVSLLTELTGAEDAIVVNNCASALVLALNTVADGKA